jgi:hypothetical protein
MPPNGGLVAPSETANESFTVQTTSADVELQQHVVPASPAVHAVPPSPAPAVSATPAVSAAVTPGAVNDFPPPVEPARDRYVNST